MCCNIFFDLGWTLENEYFSQLDRGRKVVDCCRKMGASVFVDQIFALQDEAGRNGISDVFNYAVSHLGISEAYVPMVLETAKWDPSYMIMYHDALNLVDRLSRKNVLGIIANQSKPVQDRLIAYEISPYFNTVISSCETGYSKPAMEIFTLALEQMGNTGRECWMIGDRIDNDIVPAKKMGWKTIRVLQGNHRQQEPVSEIERADYTVSTLSEILSLIG
jgi:FMN phosphatase YigB (HAD superfamily)